jgi:hypothetical protein
MMTRFRPAANAASLTPPFRIAATARFRRHAPATVR